MSKTVSVADPYNAAVRASFADPEHAGEIDGAASAYFEDQGLSVELYATLAGDRIDTMRFLAWGCPHVLAAAEWLCQFFEGRPVAELDKFPSAQIMRDLAVPVEKTGRILVLEDTVRSLRAAIRDRLPS